MPRLCANYAECLHILDASASEIEVLCQGCKISFKEFTDKIGELIDKRILSPDDELYLFLHQYQILTIVKEFLKQVVDRKARTLPGEYQTFILAHPQGCSALQLEKLLNVTVIRSYCAKGKISATKTGNIWSVLPGGIIWACEKRANWISTHSAAKLAMADGKSCPVYDDRLRELVLLGEFPPQGEDIFGNLAILRSYLPSLGKDYYEVCKRHAQIGIRRDFLREGELTPEMIHDELPEISYKTILKYLARGIISGENRKGRYAIDQEGFREFLTKAAGGELKIIPQPQQACQSYLSQIVK